MIPKFGVLHTPNQFEQMTLQGRERRQTHKNAPLNRRYRKYCIVRCRFVQAGKLMTICCATHVNTYDCSEYLLRSKNIAYDSVAYTQDENN